MHGAEQAYPGHVELPERSPEGEPRMTVAEYLLHKLNNIGVNALHTSQPMSSYPLCRTALNHSLVEPLLWQNLQHALWAGKISGYHQGLAGYYCPDDELHLVFEGVIQSTQEITPSLFVVRRSLKTESKELCGLPLSIREKGRKELRDLIQKLSAAHYVLEDRRVAAMLIDRAIEIALELRQPVVLDLPDEVALSYIPAHFYKRTFFNYEEKDPIKNCWRTITARLEQAHHPLFILGQECAPWHSILFALAEKYNTPIVACVSLWGHLCRSSLPVQYTVLDNLDLPDKEDFDSIFTFGVPADCHWLETMVTHHDLHPTPDQELFVLHTNGISFGDGRDPLPSPSIKEFFALSPFVDFVPTKVPSKENEKQSDFMPLIQLANSPHSALLSPFQNYLLSHITAHDPFSRLFVQPSNCDESWFAVSKSMWSALNPGETVFIAGNGQLFEQINFYAQAYSSLLIYLLHDGYTPIHKVASKLNAIILEDDHSIAEWKRTQKQPGIIDIYRL